VQKRLTFILTYICQVIFPYGQWLIWGGGWPSPPPITPCNFWLRGFLCINVRRIVTGGLFPRSFHAVIML